MIDTQAYLDTLDAMEAWGRNAADVNASLPADRSTSLATDEQIWTEARRFRPDLYPDTPDALTLAELRSAYRVGYGFHE